MQILAESPYYNFTLICNTVLFMCKNAINNELLLYMCYRDDQLNYQDRAVNIFMYDPNKTRVNQNKHR